MKALILSGIQNDFLPGGMEEMPGIGIVAANIQSLWTEYTHRILVNFWLPPTHLMFAGNHLWRKPGQVLNIDGQNVTLTTMFCIQNSYGAENPSYINTQEVHHTILLGTVDNWLLHSAFSHKAGNGDTGLLEYLQAKQIDELVFAGLPFETIIVESALNAVIHGFQVGIVKNACTGRSEEAIMKSSEVLENAGVTLI